MAFGPCFSSLGVVVVFGALVLVWILWLCNFFMDYFSKMKKKTLCSKKKKKNLSSTMSLSLDTNRCLAARELHVFQLPHK